MKNATIPATGENRQKPSLGRRIKRAFTLIELLVSMTILAVLLLLLAQLLDQVQRTWNYAEGRVSQFREARVAFDIITKNLSQASLNTYWDYEYEDNIVTNYKRTSELHVKTFNGKDLTGEIPGTISGHAIAFQAPLGFSNQFRNLNNLFNARGYFVAYGSDKDFTPSILQNKIEEKFRYRLMEYRPPSEENQIYIDGSEEREKGNDAEFTKWFRYDTREYSHPLAENIITLVLSPRDTLETTSDDERNTYSRIARDYTFDSNTHPDARYIQQVPPLVRVTMVAIDEASAIRMGDHDDLVPENLFRDTGLFDDDIAALTKKLQENEPPVNHKVFSTMVAIRSSKWSTYTP